MLTLQRAIEIATEAHAGQVDKGGAPYIEHVLRVVNSAWLETDQERVIAALHDVLEDTDWTADTLLKEGLSVEALATLDALTRRHRGAHAETYTGYLLRLAADPMARKVKLADLADNLAPERAGNIDSSLRERYAHARALLISIGTLARGAELRRAGK